MTIQLGNNWQLVELQCGWSLVNSKDGQLSPSEYIWKKVKFMGIKPYVSIALACAELGLPIYEARYPKDNRVKDCIIATKKYLAGNITLKDLKIKRADAASSYAAAADAATYAADAATYAADDDDAPTTTKERIKWFQEWLTND